MTDNHRPKDGRVLSVRQANRIRELAIIYATAVEVRVGNQLAQYEVEEAERAAGSALDDLTSYLNRLTIPGPKREVLTPEQKLRRIKRTLKAPISEDEKQELITRLLG